MWIAKKYFIHLIGVLLLLIIFSCSTRVKVDIAEKSSNLSDKNTPLSSQVRVNIMMKDFLYLYLKDLLGFQTPKEFIDILGMEEYLNSTNDIDDAVVSYVKEGKDKEIQIDFETRNLLATLEDLDIPYTHVTSNTPHVLRVSVTRVFFELLFTQIKLLEDIDFASIVLPEEGINKVEFVDQISWAFGDYADPDLIERDINASKIHFDFLKNGNKYTEEGKEYSKSFGIIAVLFSDTNTVEVNY